MVLPALVGRALAARRTAPPAWPLWVTRPPRVSSRNTVRSKSAYGFWAAWQSGPRWNEPRWPNRPPLRIMGGSACVRTR